MTAQKHAGWFVNMFEQSNSVVPHGKKFVKQDKKKN